MPIFNKYNGGKNKVLEGRIDDPEMKPHFQAYERKMQLLKEAGLK